MSELKPVPCAKCGERPEVQDKRIRFVVICDCETPTNYVFGNSVGFLDHIENEEVAQIAFDAVNVNELKLTAIEAWNKEQEVLRLTAIATNHATRADELYEVIDAALRIKQLWLPYLKVDDEHTGEAEALWKMARNFELALDKSRIEAEEGL